MARPSSASATHELISATDDTSTADKILLRTWNAKRDGATQADNLDEAIQNSVDLLGSAEYEDDEESITAVDRSMAALEAALPAKRSNKVTKALDTLKQETQKLQKKYDLSTRLLDTTPATQNKAYNLRSSRLHDASANTVPVLNLHLGRKRDAADAQDTTSTATRPQGAKKAKISSRVEANNEKPSLADKASASSEPSLEEGQDVTNKPRSLKLNMTNAITSHKVSKARALLMKHAPLVSSPLARRGVSAPTTRATAEKKRQPQLNRTVKPTDRSDDTLDEPSQLSKSDSKKKRTIKKKATGEEQVTDYGQMEEDQYTQPIKSRSAKKQSTDKRATIQRPITKDGEIEQNSSEEKLTQKKADKKSKAIKEDERSFGLRFDVYHYDANAQGFRRIWEATVNDVASVPSKVEVQVSQNTERYTGSNTSIKAVFVTQNSEGAVVSQLVPIREINQFVQDKANSKTVMGTPEASNGTKVLRYVVHANKHRTSLEDTLSRGFDIISENAN